MLIIKVIKAKTFWEKTVGLIGKKSPFPLVIKSRFGIHTFGLKFPIDVVVLDKKQRVAVMKQNLLPNTFFFWNPIYDLILELPSGTIKHRRIKKRVKIRFS
ncbi:DUF192 domain-containing protein [Candidatus Gottesmanbacteria bacterium]|nr:DUF192 domain-containing protein [Candidatus Gottesmanbacteria bacterium]